MKITKPLDRVTLEILRTMARIEIDFLLIGATAREILLSHVHGLAPGRVTSDIDFAVPVENWDEFHESRQTLVDSASSITPSDKLYKFNYKTSESGEYSIDIIPFGGVTDDSDQLQWPPDGELVMNMAGYPEVMQAAVRVEIEEGLSVKIASLAGLAILKLLAWQDRRGQTTKDAEDLVIIIDAFHKTEGEDRPWESLYEDVFERLGWNPDDMWAWLLGHDMRVIASDQTQGQLVKLLSDYNQQEQLIRHMQKATQSEDRLRHLISLILDGLQSAAPPRQKNV